MKEFWLNLMRQASDKAEGKETSVYQQDENQIDPVSIIAILAGACFGLERNRQGTREEILELMESYLEVRYEIPLVKGWRNPCPLCIIY